MSKRRIGTACDVDLRERMGNIAIEGYNGPNLNQLTKEEDQRRGNNGFPTKQTQRPEIRPYSPPPPPPTKK